MARGSRPLAVVLIFLASTHAGAGIFGKKNRQSKEEVPGAHPPVAEAPMVTTNGVKVPPWAARRLRLTQGSVYGVAGGRRPWAIPTQQVYTGPAGRWARAEVYGFGLGLEPGFTNGSPMGNYPMASVGPNSDIQVPLGATIPYASPFRFGALPPSVRPLSPGPY